MIRPIARTRCHRDRRAKSIFACALSNGPTAVAENDGWMEIQKRYANCMSTNGHLQWQTPTAHKAKFKVLIRDDESPVATGKGVVHILCSCLAVIH